jgi:hypothetical protein
VRAHPSSDSCKRTVSSNRRRVAGPTRPRSGHHPPGAPPVKQGAGSPIISPTGGRLPRSDHLS